MRCVAEELRKYIKDYMHQKGVKQCYIASSLGYDQKKFSRMLNGDAKIQIEDLVNISRYFGEPINRFFPPVLEKSKS